MPDRECTEACVRGGSKYTIGLEFVGGMKWKLPESLTATDR